MTLYVLAGALVVVIVARVWLGDRKMDLSALTVAFAPVNRVRFALRNALHFSRGEPALVNESKDALFDYLQGAARARAIARADDIRSRYDLSRIDHRSTLRAFRENLYVLAILDAHAAALVTARGQFVVVDVGSKDFVYATALAAFGEKHSRTAPRVTGVEIDGHVIYKDLRSRADYAHAWAKAAGPGVEYVVNDFLRHDASAPVHLVTIFYPFVTRFALLQWGLPAGEYRPEALLAHAAAMLAPDGGVLVVVNHTHEERDVLHALMTDIAGVKLAATSDVDCELVDYFDDVRERSVSVYVRA